MDSALKINDRLYRITHIINRWRILSVHIPFGLLIEFDTNVQRYEKYEVRLQSNIYRDLKNKTFNADEINQMFVNPAGDDNFSSRCYIKAYNILNPNNKYVFN